jgi:putative ABC transport system substrate-binding protein
MKRRAFVGLVGSAVAWPAGLHAQANRTVGLLSTGSIDYLTSAFFKGLSSTGFEEGRNIAVFRRSAEGKFDRLPGLAAELVSQGVSVIFASGGPLPTRAAKAATGSIPIVFAYGGDPVADGLVSSISRPDANVTGATFLGATFTAKRLELLKQLMPAAADIAMLVNPKSTLAEIQLRDARVATQTLGQKLNIFSADGANEIDAAFAEMARRKEQVVLIGTDPAYGLVFRDRIVSLAAQYKLPALYDSRDFIVAGGLVSYGSVLPDTWRQAGIYVGRVLKGEKPADLPIVQPTRFETVINLKTARTLGLEVPPGVLALADDMLD